MNREVEKLLRREFGREEVRLILAALKTEKKGGTYRAGRLGIAASLEKRGWLVRDAHGNLRLTEATRKVLALCGCDP